MPAFGSVRAVIVSCGVADSLGGAGIGLPLLAWGRSIPASLERGGVIIGDDGFGGEEGDCVSIRDDLVHAD